MSHVELIGLSKRYGHAVAVEDLSLNIARGEAVGLLGPSGCGKTTTLRMLAGLIDPDAGSIHVAGQDLTRTPAYRRNMGYVFQAYALFPHITVAANVAFGLAERRIPKAERAPRVRDALAMVRLDGYENRRPRELSGGQQQRVALARALVLHPEVLLLDESLSNLDAKLRETMRHEIREIQRTLGITTLFVTHDQAEALTMCDRIAVMHQGRIVQIGTPRDIYDAPATRFVASFVGRANVLPVERDAEGALTLAGQPIWADKGGAVSAPGELDIFIRPERMRIANSVEGAEYVNRVSGRVARTVFVGDRTEVLLDTPAGRITVDLSSGNHAPKEGEEVAAVWQPTDTLLFPRDAA